METKKRKITITPYMREVITIFLIFVACWLLEFTKIPYISRITLILYIIIIIYWTHTMLRRVIQNQVKKYLSILSMLCIVWMGIMYIKYNIIDYVHAERYLWYSFYLPLCFIPTLTFSLSLSIGNYENKRVPAWILVFNIISLILFVFVFTNDRHQLVFGFPNGITHFKNGEYTHEFGYYLVVLYSVLMIVGSIGIVYYKGHKMVKNKSAALPFIITTLAIAYLIAYILANDFLDKLRLGNMTLIITIMFFSLIESFLYLQLIQSNTYYHMFFFQCGIEMEIVDKSLNSKLRTTAFNEVPDDVIVAAIKNPVYLDDKTRISAKKISKGYILYKEDISNLITVNKEIEDKNDLLSDYNELLTNQMNQEEKLYRLSERNKAYDQIQSTTAEQITRLSILFNRLASEQDIDVSKALLKEAIIIGAYVKRIDNLMLNRINDSISQMDIITTFNETIRALNDVGIRAQISYDINQIESNRIINLYMKMEEIIENNIHNMYAVLINVSSNKLRMTLSTKLPIANVYDYVSIIEEDDLYYINYSLDEVGDIYE